MAKKDQIDQILTRGVEVIYPNSQALKKLLTANRQITLYQGFDPTGPELHLGHGAGLLKLKQFQDLGHQVIILIGDFTAMIGDPTDKLAVRQSLTKDQIKTNIKSWRRQFGKILDLSKTKIVYNSRWLKNLKLEELLHWSSQITVSQMLERDMFQHRLKSGKPIYLHEFIYPLMQGYDSVKLGVNLEVGASDQTFNMLMGRTLMKTTNRDKLVMTLKLLVDPVSGKKMGKTEGNMVTLNTPPNNMYGQIMSWSDEIVPLAFELCTTIDKSAINTITADHPKIAKMTLAYKIVELYHGATQAKKAQNWFEATFKARQIPKDNLILITGRPNQLLSGVLLSAGLISSKSQWRRLINQGGVTILPDDKITNYDYLLNKPVTIKIGKKIFAKIQVE